MRTWGRVIGIATLVLACAESAQAGVYSTLEPKWELSADYFRLFQEKSLTPLKQLGSPEAKLEWQKNYQLAALALMVAKEPPWQVDPKVMPVDQQLNLAVCLLRVREPGKGMTEKAFAILKAARTRDTKNYFVVSTLGTTHQLLGENYKAAAAATALTNPKAAEKTANQMKTEYSNADTWLDSAWKSYWSKPYKDLTKEHKEYLKDTWGWGEQDYTWYALCEKYHAHLVKLRFREMSKSPLDFAKALDKVDLLFDPTLKFIGESGQFEAGKIAKAEMDKVPADATKIVEQLLIWMPDDLRLYRLLGELFNAKGDVESAKIVFEEQLGKFSQTREGFGLKDDELLVKFTEKYPDMGGRLKALRSYVPPPVAPINATPEAKAETATSASKKADTPAPVAGSLNLDWQTLTVGMGAGVLIGFLAAWRLRDALKRRQMRAAPPFTSAPVNRR
ncbi:MAG TPA: hypothetical protein VE988_05885 [Gemmataceae bacterium]|nr:hypothetical protein [Gemmataceae bacterium]